MDFNLADQEINRLQVRIDELQMRIIRDLDNQTQQIYGQIMLLKKGSEHRLKLENEYAIIAKELTLRSDEERNLKQQIENLEIEKNSRSRLR
jgi:hypothetical protein